jgi:hypothetical protein
MISWLFYIEFNLVFVFVVKKFQVQNPVEWNYETLKHVLKLH